ncbi:MAG: sulfite exporter TauE/SafE family protein [Alphaproteobacteria bacterium]
MDVLHFFNALYAISGFAIGLIVGMTGMGGGSLMTPLLILLFGVVPVTAVGTDLLFAAATKTGGTLVHGLHRTIDWRVVGRLALGSVPSTGLTLFVLSRFESGGAASANLITFTLGGALLVSALALIFRKWIWALYAPRMVAMAPSRIAKLTVAIGAVLGIVVSISSVGAGAIGVTALVLLYPKLPMARIVGSDIAHAVPLTLLAGIGHWMLGSIDWTLFMGLLIGSLPGIALGSYVSARIPDWVLRYLLAAVLVVIGCRLLV